MSEQKRKAPHEPPFAMPSKRSKRSPAANTDQTLTRSVPETSQVSVSLRRETTLRLESNEPNTSKSKETKEASLSLRENHQRKPSKKAGSSEPIKSRHDIDTHNSIFMPNIPSGLTKLALTPTTSMFRLSVSAADLVTTIDDDEMMAALASLKSVDLDTIPVTEQTRLIDDEELKGNAYDELNNREESVSRDDLKPDGYDMIKAGEESTDGDELIERSKETNAREDLKSGASATTVADAPDLKSSPAPTEEKSADGLNKRGKPEQEIETEKDKAKTTEAAHSSESLYELALSICHTHSMEPGILFKIKEVIKKLQESIPEIRIAVICHGGSSHNSVVQWIDFNTSQEEIFAFIDAVPRTYQPVGVKAAELIKQVVKETLSWSPGSYRSFDWIGTVYRFDIEETALKLLRNLNWRKEKPSSSKAAAQNSGLRKDKAVSDKAVADSNVPVISKCISKPAKQQKNVKNPKRQKTNKEATRKKPETYDTVQKSVKLANRTTTASKVARTGRKWSQTPTVRDVHKKTRYPSRNLSAKKQSQKRSTALDKNKILLGAEIPLIRNTQTQKKTHREELTDAQFNAGVMKKLKWTDWFLTMCYTIPSGYSRIDFKQQRNSEYFHRQNLAGKLKVNALYEFGVKLPRCKTIIPVCLQNCWNTKGDKSILTMNIQRNKKIRLEVDRLLKNNCKIYVRGASMSGKGKGTELTVSNIKSHLKTIDYAWSNHGNGRHRKLIRNKIIISDDTL